MVLELERTDDSRRWDGELSSRERVCGSGVDSGIRGDTGIATDTQTTELGGGGIFSVCLDCRRGLSCRKCLQDDGTPSSLVTYAISRRTPNLRLAHALHNNDDKQTRRVRRFYQRYFTGVAVGGTLRLLTLTHSDVAVARGYDIHRHFTALVKRLRRRWGAFEYMGVVEVKGGREHLHIVFRGSYLEQASVSAMWAQLHASPVVDVRAIWGSRGGAHYLAKYLAKAQSRYWASYHWVFAGWVGFSKRVCRAFGRYPSRGLLAGMARLDASVRYRLLCVWADRLNDKLPLLPAWYPSRRGVVVTCA